MKNDEEKTKEPLHRRQLVRVNQMIRCYFVGFS